MRGLYFSPCADARRAAVKVVGAQTGARPLRRLTTKLLRWAFLVKASEVLDAQDYGSRKVAIDRAGSAAWCLLLPMLTQNGSD